MATMHFFMLLISLLLIGVNAVVPKIFASNINKLKSLEALYDTFSAIEIDVNFIPSLEIMQKIPPSDPKFGNEFIKTMKNAMKRLLERRCSNLPADQLHQLLDGVEHLGIPQEYSDEVWYNKFKLRIKDIDNTEFKKLFKESILGLLGFQIDDRKKIIEKLLESEKKEVKKLRFLLNYIQKSSSSFDNELISKLKEEKQLRPQCHHRDSSKSIAVFRMVLENYFQNKRGNVMVLSEVIAGLQIINITVKFVAEIIDVLNELKQGKIDNANFITNLKTKFSGALQHQIKVKEINLKLTTK